MIKQKKVFNLSKNISPKFIELIHNYQNNLVSEIVLTGGRGSTKSSCIGFFIPFFMLFDYYTKKEKNHAVIVRKIGTSIEGSVYNQVKWCLDKMGILDQWHCIKKPYQMTYKKTGQTIYFHGCDDPTKIKSIKPATGYIKWRWFEEYDQFNGIEEIRNLNQSLARGGKTLGLYSFNPPPMSSHWANKEMSVEKKGRLHHHSTYLDVNPEWLGDDFIKDAEHLKKHNELAYNNEMKGLVTGLGSGIFKNVKSITFSDEFIGLFEKVRQGLDFGFANDPSAFCKLCYDKGKNGIYIFKELYKYSEPTKDLSYEINDICDEWETIKADSQESRTINTMQTEYDVNLIGCKKGPDSVRHGIKFLQDLDFIAIDRKRCPNTYQEFTTYEYPKNKEGKFINQFPDENNHAIDAVRYSLDDIILASGWRVPKKQKNKR